MPTVIHLDSLADPRFAPFAGDYAGVKERQLSAAFGAKGISGGPDAPSGKLYAEGQTVLTQLVHSNHRTLSVLTTPARLETIADDVAKFATDVPIFVIDPSLMESIVGFSMHRGLLAVAARAKLPTLAELLAQTRDSAGPLLVLEDLANHDNVGACFRIAAAFGCRAVVLSPQCADPLYRKALRVSSGHALRMPWCWGAQSDADWPRAIGQMHAAGYTTLAMTPRGERSLEAALKTARSPLAMLIGAEGPGLRQETLSACHRRVCLQMAGGVDSLNAAIACAVGLYEITKTSHSTSTPF